MIRFVETTPDIGGRACLHSAAKEPVAASRAAEVPDAPKKLSIYFASNEQQILLTIDTVELFH